MAIVDDPSTIDFIKEYCDFSSPVKSVAFEYLTEGAANVVFTLCLTDQELIDHDGSLVLRLRKDLPFTIPIIQAQSEFESHILPLFSSNPELLLTPRLFRLSKAIVQSLNQELHKVEDRGIRPSARQYVYLPAFEVEPQALLLPNLNHGFSTSIEFKPKWLVQSPSAPAGARRCRTCALNGMRRQKGARVGRGDSGFCPFILLSSDQQVLEKTLAALWSDQASLSTFAAGFQLTVQPALRLLQGLQSQHNEVGLNDFEQSEGKDFSVAMALRDCSFFLSIGRVGDPSHGVQINAVKILDLDLKSSGGGKLEKWADTERELISGGWYTDGGDFGINCAMPLR